MPFSSNALDSLAASILEKLKPGRLFDIGAGAGKYGKIARSVAPQAELVAVEIDQEYIELYDLNEIYGTVYHMSAEALISPAFYKYAFDTVIIGDAIQHLRKSVGVDLLNFLIYRSRWIIVIYPKKYIQNEYKGKPHEAHISAWSESDFSTFDISDTQRNDGQVLVLLRGYVE